MSTLSYKRGFYVEENTNSGSDFWGCAVLAESDVYAWRVTRENGCVATSITCVEGNGCDHYGEYVNLDGSIDVFGSDTDELAKDLSFYLREHYAQ